MSKQPFPEVAEPPRTRRSNVSVPSGDDRIPASLVHQLVDINNSVSNTISNDQRSTTSRIDVALDHINTTGHQVTTTDPGNRNPLSSVPPNDTDRAQQSAAQEQYGNGEGAFIMNNKKDHSAYTNHPNHPSHTNAEPHLPLEQPSRPPSAQGATPPGV